MFGYKKRSMVEYEIKDVHDFKEIQHLKEFKGDKSIYEETERHISQKLQEKEKEIERLKQQLSHFKNSKSKDGQQNIQRRKSKDQRQTIQSFKRDSTSHHQSKCSRSRERCVAEQHTTFKPDINSRSRKLIRKSDV